MWKWIAGVLLLIVVLLAGMCWYGYKKLTAGGATAVVAIAAPPARVWATVTNLDSMKLWMTGEIFTGGPTGGILAVGDSFETRNPSGKNDREFKLLWVVRESVSQRVRVLEGRDDSLHIAFLRRDSLSAVGDSTMLFTTFSAPMFDSLRAEMDKSGKGGGLAGAVMRGSSKLMMAGLRLQAESDFSRLKARLEDKPMQERR